MSGIAQTTASADDARLAAALEQGDEAALAEVRRWIRGALTPYRARLAADCEDIEQQVIAELVEALSRRRFEGRSRLATYVHRMVHHKCLNRLRGARGRQWFDVDEVVLIGDRSLTAVPHFDGTRTPSNPYRTVARRPSMSQKSSSYPAVVPLHRAGILACAGAALLAGPIRAAVYYVGASAAQCDATTIQEALDLVIATGADDEIRLTRTLTYDDVALVVGGDPDVHGNLVISGGWDDCADASPSGRTALVGDGSSRVLVVADASGATTPVEVTLRALDISAGSDGVAVFGLAKLVVHNSLLHHNLRGGLVGGGAELEIGPATVIENNVGSTHGAGLACALVSGRLVVAGTVRSNAALTAGGGIFATENCEVALRAGATIVENGSQSGGGIAIMDGARLTGGGAGAAPARIADNVASAMGGGLYFAGPAPQSLVGNVRIEANRAAGGAGVYLEGDVVFQLERFNFEQCADDVRCTTLSGNRTTSAAGWGSAALVGDGAEFRMMQGYIEANGGDGASSQVLTAAASGSIFLEGVQIAGNDTESIFHTVAGGDILVGFVTAARNRYWDETSEQFVNSRGADISDGGSLNLYTSILADHGPFESAGGVTIYGDCMMVDTTQGMTEVTATMVGVDPRFRDPSGGDLHLRPDSPAIDSCDSAVYTPIDVDFDLDPRGFDSPMHEDEIGRFDRGADESPLQFTDGFESGDTGAWSAVTP